MMIVHLVALCALKQVFSTLVHIRNTWGAFKQLGQHPNLPKQNIFRGAQASIFLNLPN